MKHIGRQIKLDIHGLTSGEAKKKVLKAIEKAPSDTEKIVIIHGCNNGTVLRDMVRRNIRGCNNGTVLRDMVRRNIRSPRIYDIIPTFSNDGETTVYLKK